MAIVNNLREVRLTVRRLVEALLMEGEEFPASGDVYYLYFGSPDKEDLAFYEVIRLTSRGRVEVVQLPMSPTNDKAAGGKWWVPKVGMRTALKPSTVPFTVGPNGGTVKIVGYAAPAVRWDGNPVWQAEHSRY